ncbi:MAG: glutamate racemase [Deferribacteraceae bacterium]|jgi:glutamate racemase|nr:glutamate racemase [Deferribacteraceae bacterium]
MPVGVFDSGVGGLTVYRELIRALPDTDFIYLGDTARVPYGARSKEIIIQYALELARYLTENYHTDQLVAACNTISSCALEAIEREFNVPTFGVIAPGAESAVELTKNNRIGVIGTLATISSGAYKQAVARLSGATAVFQAACPLLAALVEEGILEGEIPQLAIKMYLEPLIDKGIDTLILGCTHYPLLAPLIREIYPHLSVTDSTKKLIPRIDAKVENGRRIIMVTDAGGGSTESLKTRLVGGIPLKKAALS